MIVYSAPGCSQCRLTIRWLEDHGREYEKRDAGQHREDLLALGHTSAPVVVLDTGESFSGFRPDRLAQLGANETAPSGPSPQSVEDMTPAARIELQQRISPRRQTIGVEGEQNATLNAAEESSREAVV